jgi:hypothetical protein
MATIASAIIAPAAWNQVERSSASLQTNSEVAGLGLRSMLTPQISDVWRLAPAAVGQVVLMVDVGLDTVAQLVLLAAPRDGVLPLTGSTWRIVCSRTDGTQVYDSGALPLEPVPRALWPHVLPQPVTARYWRITFDFAAGQPYAQFGRLLIQPALVTTRAISYGQQRGVVDAGSNERSAYSGVRYATRGARFRQPSWTLPRLTTAEAETLEDIALAAGTTGQVFAAPSLQALQRDGVLGPFRSPPMPRRITHLYWSAEIAQEEDC